MTQPSLSDVLLRVERVEREGRRWKAVALLATVLLGALLLSGSVRPTPTLDTQMLVIRNSDREIVTRIGTDAAGMPVLTMHDRDGAIRVTLALQESGEAYLGVWGPANRSADSAAAAATRGGAWLAAGPDVGIGRVTVYDRDGRAAWTSPRQATTPTLGIEGAAPASPGVNTGRIAPSPANASGAGPAAP